MRDIWGGNQEEGFIRIRSASWYDRLKFRKSDFRGDMTERKSYYKTRLRGRGQITIPPEIRKKLKVSEGDDVLFFVNEQGQIVIDQVQIIDPEQAWFWTERWQKAEMESRRDYLNGDFFEFDDAESAIRFLNELDKEEAKRNAEN